MANTPSRRSGPRRWLRAVEWLIAAGLHGRANATTLTVAEDLAARMDYDLGHARYCLDEMTVRLGMSRATVKRHISYLRELGALAWVQHGTRTNIRQAMGLKGYAATATVYAGVIPPAYDHAMGHRIVGTGYNARIIVDYRGRQKPNQIPTQNHNAWPGTPVDNPPVDNSGLEACEPPSLTSGEEEGKLKMVGGSNYTSQAPRDDAASPIPQIEKRSSQTGTGRHALQVAKDILIARQVRPLVNWTQREGLRRLAFSLRPLIDHGMNSYSIAEYLHGLCPGTGWRPKAPAAYISTVLADRARTTARQAEAAARFEMENPAEGAFQARAETRIDLMAAVQQGIDRYRQTCRTRGLDDLSGTTEWNAEADILAFLNGSPA
ncbi:cell wall protein [Streptomyces sp. NPDC002623]